MAVVEMKNGFPVKVYGDFNCTADAEYWADRNLNGADYYIIPYKVIV